MKLKQTISADEAKGFRSWDSLPLLLTAADTAGILGISRESVYDLFVANEIPHVFIGKRRRVPKESLRRWVER